MIQEFIVLRVNARGFLAESVGFLFFHLVYGYG